MSNECDTSDDESCNAKRTTSAMGTESRTRRVMVCKVSTLLNVVNHMCGVTLNA